MMLPSLLRTPPPSVAVEISPRHVAAVEVTGTAPESLRVNRFVVEELAPGVVVPSLNAPNVTNPAALAQAIRGMWDQLGHRPRRVAMVVPDALAKVSFVRFQSVPSRSADLDDLIRFQIKKAAPFRVEDSQVSYSRGLKTAEGQEFVVVQARRDIVREYESACQAAGAEPGLVDLATFSVANTVMGGRPAPGGDWLLVSVSAGGSALAIHRGQQMVFFRHRSWDGEGSLGDLVHQTAMYYQDRLGGSGFSRVFVAGSTHPDGGQTAGKTIEARLGRAVEMVDPLSTVGFSDRATLSGGMADALSPAIGVAVAQRTEAQAGRIG